MRHVLWSAGWDSTFLVAKAVLVDCATIQPYYLFTTSRRSAGRELFTLQRLKMRIRAMAAGRAGRILPTRVVEHDALPVSETRAAQYASFRKLAYLGEQYLLLACMADYLSLDQLEIGVYWDGRIGSFLRDARVGRYPAWAAGRTPELEDALRLLEPFEFPLLDLTKHDMAEQAARYGFLPILRETWFCHRPRGERPCGECNPCRYAMEEGFGWRIPLGNRVRGRIRRTFYRAHRLISDPDYVVSLWSRMHRSGQ
ncbi:hypothetical protein DEM34_15135 [Spiribacter halobius]|uniref:7-cyano-7-deazaguanine synthase n=1 Tax=Sediminicurvatus halobius TaxID=2182432 RepID=A0A2U2MY32_9GAMM|nr:hypothetical protein DEM34_15135 [Spiribacter halobius]